LTGRIDPLAAGCGVALVVRYPWLAAAIGLPAVTTRYRSMKSVRADRVRAAFDSLTVGRVVQVGLAGGLPLTACLTLARAEVGRVVAAELETTLRLTRREGIAAALSAGRGQVLGPLFARVALAQVSGAPMREAVAAYLADARASRRGIALERVRRLPVALMVPLGLLILPGFVVLFVGPILLDSLVDLSGALP
jgi:hypothetical protein